MAGFVSLVGAGPGDPGLVTTRAMERLSQADVVVHDRLVSPELLAMIPPRARLVDVGKAPGRAEMSQDDINRVLVEEAQEGQRVVRLKGGDPFVFGRGGEEADALARAGVPYEVVPGITSALAGPAAAGIPVTHRGVATSVTVVTGHEDPTKPESQTDWDALARTGGTLCILMGAGRLADIVDRLIGGGRSPHEPAAAVVWATTPRQTTIRTTLGSLPSAGVQSPAVVVVGPVAALDFSGALPLSGRTVVVTRARERASALRTRLESLGARVLEAPVIAFEEPSEPHRLRAAVADLASTEWVVFTSPTGVERAFAAIDEAGGDARWFGGCRIAAIGPGTAASLTDRGLRADLVPEAFVAEALAEAFPEGGGRVLLLRAEEAREVLPERLRQKGWTVDVVPAYRTVMGDAGGEARRALLAGEVDAVTFTSSSTVRNFLDLVGDAPPPPVVACIGPVTATTAEEMGWTATVVASEHTIEGLVAAMLGALASTIPP